MLKQVGLLHLKEVQCFAFVSIGPQPHLFPCHGCSGSSAALWHGMSTARVRAWLELGHAVRQLRESQQLPGQTFLHLAWGKPASASSSRGESRLLQPFSLSQQFSIQPRGLSPPHRTSGLGCPVCGSTRSAPRAGVCAIFLYF